MNFQVETRGSITRIDPKVPHVIISISDEAGDRAEPATNDLTLDVLFLDFHDINASREDMTLFSEAHAKKILDFFQRYRNEASLVIAHCTAGMSRSPAVVAALQKITTGNDDVWFKTKTPNSLVYNTVLGLAHDRGLYR